MAIVEGDPVDDRYKRQQAVGQAWRNYLIHHNFRAAGRLERYHEVWLGTFECLRCGSLVVANAIDKHWQEHDLTDQLENALERIAERLGDA